MSHLIGPHLATLHQVSKDKTRLPDSHFSKAVCSSDNPTIPNPDIFKNLDGSRKDQLPTTAQCAVHLELLEAFHALRVSVIGSSGLDKTFGLAPKTKTVYRRTYVSRLRKYVNEPTKIKDSGWEEERRKKWPRYLDFAAERFVEWAKKIDSLMAKRASQTDSDGSPSSKLHEAQLPCLPPLDILMLKDNKIEPSLCDYLEDLGKAKGLDSPPNEASEGAEPVAAVSIKSPHQSAFLSSLIANVTRQLVFVDKMHGHLWIRSPALPGTLDRAVERYDNYLELFRLYPGKMLVPTLDIDLVWHTHQLSAHDYKTAMKSRCGRFINHDDKLGKPTLDTGMENTQELYQVHFGQMYSICLCWDCEAVVSALEAYDDDDTRELTDPLADKVSNQVLRDVQYYKAVEIARRRGDTLLPVPR
ncbi:hypothetical protein G7Z17_g2108 [Cylindrodendrum hubeiense]|uniref:Uncharacterized protein n=1 Tax=Cylindrodendrum hubeiense TaxID=595255 RepID=A0A9P5HI92_9HYPO|nr:hypothetical protein G7Z17_g2108 [Cylindrodendrum hubeiense]